MWCAGLVAGLTIPLEEKQERSRREGGHGRRASLAFDREALHIYRHVRTECSLTIYLYAFKLIYSFDLFIFFGEVCSLIEQHRMASIPISLRSHQAAIVRP